MGSVYSLSFIHSVTSLINSCKQMCYNEQYFYKVLGVRTKHENDGNITYLHLTMSSGFCLGQAQFNCDVAFNLSNSVHYIFNTATLRLMYFGTLSKFLKQKQQIYARSTMVYNRHNRQLENESVY